MATPVRCAIAVAMGAPIATVLGFCFPLGLRAVDRIAPEATAWMWGINGACGVLASIAAVAVSISLGIRANLLGAAILYHVPGGPGGCLGRTGKEPIAFDISNVELPAPQSAHGIVGSRRTRSHAIRRFGEESRYFRHSILGKSLID